MWDRERDLERKRERSRYVYKWVERIRCREQERDRDRGRKTEQKIEWENEWKGCKGDKECAYVGVVEVESDRKYVAVRVLIMLYFNIFFFVHSVFNL